MTDQPTPKRKLEFWWTCGLPGCSHPTRAGATFHGMLMERGFSQTIMRPIQSGDMGPSPLRLSFTELVRRDQERRNQGHGKQGA